MILGPLVVGVAGGFGLLSWLSFGRGGGLGGSLGSLMAGDGDGDGYSTGNSSSSTNGFFASLGKAPTDSNAGIDFLGGTPPSSTTLASPLSSTSSTPTPNSNSGRNYLLGALAMTAVIGLQILVIEPRNREIEEVLRSGSGSGKGKGISGNGKGVSGHDDDDGEEGNRLIEEVRGWEVVRGGLVVLAWGVGVWEMAR